MSAKTSAEVVIDGKVYTLSGYEGEEYLQKVASYINGKINEFTSIEEYRHIPLNMKNTLIQLNIADDYFKAKDQVEKLERDLENKEKETFPDAGSVQMGWREGCDKLRLCMPASEPRYTERRAYGSAPLLAAG